MYSSSTVQSPSTLKEAYDALSEGSRVKVIAGGTDLMVLMNARTLAADEFLDIWGLDELRGISDEQSSLRIGALTTFSELAQSPLVGTCAPALVEASKTVGAIQIQNRATIGGNVVNASPAADSVPVLAAYDARVEIGSARGTRRVGLIEFYTDYRRTVLQPDELVLAVWVPKLGRGERDFFRKVGTRRAQAISKVVMAVKTETREGIVRSIKIGVGSVAPTVVRASQTEALLTGKQLTPTIIDQARRMIAGEVRPITDLRSTERYRRTVTGNVLASFLAALNH